ncbi:MAG: heavy-metal-associated domain-containing protein [Eubacteriales bacterium]|jgi:copper chaperone CopZ|nr:heavy-metal-associated domain-containing protein [Eubacteriales bacterium]MDD4105246.1 heavy-metal-associated domain-containing protein [Eubacteriales bacterium]MDD4711539.1 heavy-metal-associated domain-containing protein [Eubacteriales bacterium]
MKKATIQLETLTCPSCLLKIENALKQLTGIDKASINVSFNTSKAKLQFDESQLSQEAIEKSITDLGYVVMKTQVKDL